MLSEQHKRIERFEKYIADPRTSSPSDIQRDMRNALEYALKSKYYLKLRAKIKAGNWLRDFINDAQVKVILEANGTITELNEICSVACGASHDNPEPALINGDEAQTYASRTLAALEGL
jgi:hypothetical protein